MTKKDWAERYLQDADYLRSAKSIKITGSTLDDLVVEVIPGRIEYASLAGPTTEPTQQLNQGLNAEFFNSEEIRALGIQCGNGCLLHKTCIVVNPNRISMGNNVRIDGFCTLSGGLYIDLGSNIHIAGYVSLFGGSGIIIGDNAAIASGAKVYSVSDDIMGRGQVGPCVDENTRYLHKQQIVLGQHSVLAVNTVVLPGGSLGMGSVLLPFSVLTECSGDLEVWAGNTAKFVKPRKDSFLKGKNDLV